ncbi:hypothetical protein STPL106120_02235 [Streptococcus pluranimalium]
MVNVKGILNPDEFLTSLNRSYKILEKPSFI